MLQNAIGWSLLGLYAGEIFSHVLWIRIDRRISLLGITCMAIGFIRGYYGQDIVSLIMNSSIY